MGWWLTLLAFLLLAAGDTVPFPIAPPLSIGCGRFQPLPDVSLDTVHNPPSLDLHPVSPGAKKSPSYAIHTLFLDESVAQMALDIGFDTLVQVFPWRDLNPSAGYYTWTAADDMVRIASQYGLNLVIRLDMPPAWAERTSATKGLPFDLAAYADFVSAVAGRYRGRVIGYIIWNEPNLAAEWSRSGGDLVHHWSSYAGWVADPADYVGVLGVAYQRVKAADPAAMVITAGLAPTNENSPRAMDDRQFLRQMMAAGAADCFDVLGIHAYGYGLSPEVDRSAYDGLNLARLIDLQEILEASGAKKEVWITELGYTIGVGQHPDVTEVEQAEYLVGAIQRIRREWVWVDVITLWNLTYGRPQDDEMSGYSLIDFDKEPRLAYARLKQFLTDPGG